MRLPGTIALALALSGCTEFGSADVTTLMNPGNCQNVQPGVTEISFEDLARIRGSRLISADTPDGSANEPVDYRLLVVSAGTRPTSGYELQLTGARLGPVLEVSVRSAAPDQDAAPAPLAAHPCLVLVTTHLDRTIQVTDEHGNVLGLLPASPG